MGVSLRISMKVKNGIVLEGLQHLPGPAKEEMLITNQRIFGPNILATIKTNASHRPGPEPQTGLYRNSIKMVKASFDNITFGTEAPQGHRLEYGFTGLDALGREYNQPPYAHFRPAIWQWQRRWGLGMAGAVKRGILDALKGRGWS